MVVRPDQKTLGGGEWTGVSDVVVDPRDPDILYAATWQHHRTVAAYMGGGPETGIHRSTDGGLIWTELETGLPKGDMGKIGLAISPQNPDVIYAAIELERRKGGGGAQPTADSWVKEPTRWEVAPGRITIRRYSPALTSLTAFTWWARPFKNPRMGQDLCAHGTPQSAWRYARHRFPPHRPRLHHDGDRWGIWRASTWARPGDTWKTYR